MLLSNMETCQEANNDLDDQEKCLTVTSTEFQRHFGKYLALVIEGKTVIVTRYGKSFFKLIPVRDPKERESERS